MRELDDLKYNCTRRHFLSKTSLGIGALGLASLLDPRLLSGETAVRARETRRGRCCERRISCRAPSG